MAVLKIAKMGHPILRSVADSVVDPTSQEVARLLQDMVETMHDAEGTGLAAPQVHVGMRALVYFVSEKRAGTDENGTPHAEVPVTALVNPEIEVLDNRVIYDWEGCLSIPGLLGLVPRPRRIMMSATSPDGGAVEFEAADFHARVLLHECDHLNGILYPERMDDLSLLLYREELKHGVPEKAQALLDQNEKAD